MDKCVAQYDKYIAQAAKEDAQASQLMRLGGIGSITVSAIVASVGKGHALRSTSNDNKSRIDQDSTGRYSGIKLLRNRSPVEFLFVSY